MRHNLERPLLIHGAKKARRRKTSPRRPCARVARAARALPRSLPARTLRRTAAARLDRARPVRPAQGSARRRADLHARRLGAPGVLNLLRGLCDNDHLAILYITHDIASARYIADETIVMYAGQVVEQSHGTALVDEPTHPYTQLLDRLGARSRRPHQSGRQTSEHTHVRDRRAGMSLRPAVPPRRWTSVARQILRISTSVTVISRTAGCTRRTRSRSRSGVSGAPTRGGRRRRHDHDPVAGYTSSSLAR